jgi:hypothetical protein
MTIRQFKFTGSNNSGATGTITINGTEVFNGPFLGTDVLSQGETATGSVDIDNALAANLRISAPTSITVTGGEIFVALTQWDYEPEPNPVYSAEQLAILNNPETTRSEQVAIYNTVAVPPLSPADEAMLLSTDPVDRSARQAVLVAHNLTTYIQESANFGYGITPADAECNRANVLLNGSTVPGSDTNAGILVQTGDVLTYNSIVFASNLYD